MMGTYTPPRPPQNFVATKTVVTSAWLNDIDKILQGRVPADGIYQPAFASGQVQVTGPGGYLTSYGDLTFGLSLPGPGGTGPALLIGGAGKQFAQIITDEQVSGQKGINLYMAAGESATGDLSGGGDLWLFGGASTGPGGQMKIQGGTSTNLAGGDVQILGGNSSGGIGAAGNVYILAGTEGNVGGNVKVYATKLNNIAGDISFWLGQPDIPHSVPLWTMSHTGALFPGNQGAGQPAILAAAVQPAVLVTGGNLASPTWAAPGLGGLIPMTMSGAISPVVPFSLLYSIVGGIVTLTVVSNILSPATGPNDLILSALPTALIPSSTRSVFCGGLINASGGGYVGVATVQPTGAITISLLSPTNGGITLGITPNNWSILGGTSKGIQAGWTITYQLQ